MFKGVCWVNWLFMAMIAFLAVISISTMLSGCGNKGVLYLPDSNTSKQDTKKKS